MTGPHPCCFRALEWGLLDLKASSLGGVARGYGWGCVSPRWRGPRALQCRGWDTDVFPHDEPWCSCSPLVLMAFLGWTLEHKEWKSVPSPCPHPT